MLAVLPDGLSKVDLYPEEEAIEEGHAIVDPDRMLPIRIADGNAARKSVAKTVLAFPVLIGFHVIIGDADPCIANPADSTANP